MFQTTGLLNNNLVNRVINSLVHNLVLLAALKDNGDVNRIRTQLGVPTKPMTVLFDGVRIYFVENWLSRVNVRRQFLMFDEDYDQILNFQTY